ncbi:laccase [Stereum hirsutum FP-91666 SS1]|uniref:laccase n=1 Tax=Stereum hirsutum (strain FP-91666) TaxID=721885 RepID=UPI000440D15A|nr:laccase [Stereum hirsutum FP-91666 SS1]EIM91692.1 laccase [Stereum hirsutum FP-91666 SS1]
MRLVVPCLCASSYQLELTNEAVAPDGFSRSSVLANKQFPGPLLSVQKNEPLRVLVDNQLIDTSMAQGSSIHWHGLTEHKTAAQDGVAWVTQCPIAPGDSFQYVLNTAGQTGYHSHITTQYCDGLRGPLVIYDIEDPLKYLYDVDDGRCPTASRAPFTQVDNGFFIESTVITLGDWFHVVSPEAFNNFLNPDSFVINGLGRYDGGDQSPLAVVDVSAGLRHRFRIVNTACIAGFNFSIDRHPFPVIEVDGVETKPLVTDIVSLWPGQRISVVVNANQSVENYWIRATPFVLGTSPSNTTGVNAAILRYRGAQEIDPKTESIATNLMREQDLEVCYKIFSHPATYSDSTPTLQDANGTRFLVNGSRYVPPPVPVLLQILNGSIDAQEIMPIGSVITLPRDKLISITIPGGSPIAPHPFHLHGHNFQVIRSAGSATNNSKPIFRDVINTGYAGDDATFFFRTDNPGPWLLHCHIDFHLEAALAIVFAEAPEDQVAGYYAEERPKDWEALCPKWNSLTEGKQFALDDSN